ncbi:MAG: hypothetical protein LBJ77_02015 [Holosporales bacterium]|jgi:hypothetical protein|nr:hypothetical protein [Holosporales bacterium]
MAFGREGIDYHDFPSYLDAWNVQMQYETFRPDLRGVLLTTEPVKQKLLGGIGNDPLSVKAFELFHQHRFLEFTDHCISNLSDMFQSNTDRFRDLLIKAAPVINLVDGREPYIRQIIGIAGGARNVSNYIPIFPQFCYEMFLCVALDTSGEAEGEYNGKLSQAAEVTCGAIARNSDWPLKPEELKFLQAVGLREDAGGSGCIRGFIKQWCTD